MLLVNKDEDNIVDMDHVALTIEQDGAIWQILATPYGDMSSYIMNEYYSEEDAKIGLSYVLRAYLLKSNVYYFGASESKEMKEIFCEMDTLMESIYGSSQKGDTERC